jgi:hypothetical protein
MVELAETKVATKEESRSRLIGVYIAVLAVLLSVATMMGQNIDKDAAKLNLDATNTWAFFQAKNIRRQQYELAADNLRLKLLENPALERDAKAHIQTKLDSYVNDIARYSSDKKKMEGLDELFVRAKALEKKRDASLQRAPYFDYSVALVQIAIVLGSVAIVTGGNTILFVSMIIAIVGLLSGANGIFMFVDIPGL